MILDSSGIVAGHLKEPGYQRILDKLEAADVIAVGTSTLLETAMVLTSRFGHDARPMISAFLKRTRCEVVPFDDEHLDLAINAFIRFGRGRHPAGLNFGDCMSYAIAAAAEMPLLFIGDDFSKTDIAQA